MHQYRLEDLSLVYFLRDLFDPYPDVTIEDGFPEGELTLPTIAVEADPMDLRNFELGNRVKLPNRSWSIDVFGTNKAMRDEFSYFIADSMNNNVPVYDYNEGFPPPTPSQIGALEVGNITLQPVRIFPRIQEKLYWRMSIRFTTVFKSTVS